MKKLIVLLLILIPAALWAHTPLLIVEDNEDGTIYIEAGFSNGASAAGVTAIVKLKSSGEIFWQGKIGEDGTVETDMPGEPYTVTMDAGPGHIVTKDGPEPSEGFGSAPSSDNSEPAAKPAPAPAAAPPSGDVAWTPAMTSGAIPPSPPSTTDIMLVVLALLQLGVLVYIAVLVKRAGK